MKIKKLFDNSVNFTSAFHPGVNSFIDGVCDAAFFLYTFVLRHQVLAVINIAVISINLFFIWTFGKRKTKKIQPLTSAHSDRSSTYNKFLKKLKEKAQKNNANQQKHPNRNTKQYQKQLTKPLSKVPRRSPEACNLTKPINCKNGCSCCSTPLDSSSGDVEETLDEITWGFDTSPLSSQYVGATMDSAGNCLKDIYLKPGPAKTFLKVQAPLSKAQKLQQRAGTCRRTRITSDRMRNKRMAAAGQLNAKDSGDKRNQPRVPKARSRSGSPKRPVRARCAAQARLVDSESSPAKSLQKRAAAVGQASPKSKAGSKAGKKSPLKPVAKKTWDRDISSDSDVERKQPDSLYRKQQISECSDAGGTRSETSLVCKRDSWIWFSPETKASDEDFFTRQNKFKSEDPRVAELAAEIKRQDEMNKSIEREAESLIESSSQSHKYPAHQWAKAASVAPISRLKGRGRGKRCPLNARSIPKKQTSSSRLQIISTKQNAEKGYKKPTKNSTPIHTEVSQLPKYSFQEISPKCSPSDSATMMCSEKDSKTFLHGDSTTATSSPFNARAPLALVSHYEPGNANGVHGTAHGAGRRQLNNCVPMSHREMHVIKKDPRPQDHFGQCESSAGEARAKAPPELTLDEEEEQERGVSPDPVDEGSQTHLPQQSAIAYPSTINNSTHGNQHAERQHSPSCYPPAIFSMHMSTSRTYSESPDARQGPPSRKSPMLIFSTGESESESIVRDKSGQEASFRQVILHKEVNTAVHQLLFDTEQSSSSMSPTTMHRVNANITLRKLMAKEKSPVFLPRLSRDDVSCLSMWSTTSTVKMRGPSHKQAAKRTNIYNPDYYLGKRARSKKADDKPVPDSPSRWKKTDPLWQHTVSPRLYPSKQSTPSPARKANANKVRSPRRPSPPQKPKRPRQLSRVGGGKRDPSYTVHKAEPKPWGKYARCTLNRRFSSPDLRHQTSLDKCACQEPSPKCVGKWKAANVSSLVMSNRSVTTKVQKKETNGRGTPKIKNFLIACDAVDGNCKQMKPSSTYKSFGSESSSQLACARGSPKCSSSIDTALKCSSEDTQKVVTYSDTYWAKKVSLRREKRGPAASSSTSCNTKSPQLTFVKTEAAEPASSSWNGDKVSRESVEAEKASQASQLLPGSTNNSSSNDPYQHGGSVRSSKLQLVDDGAQFFFVTDKKLPCKDNFEQSFPRHETICENSKTFLHKTRTFRRKIDTDIFPKTFTVKSSKVATNYLGNISPVLICASGAQEKPLVSSYRRLSQVRKERKENRDREDETFNGQSQISWLRSHGAHITSGLDNSFQSEKKIGIAIRHDVPPPRLVGFDRIGVEQRPGSNDSGYEESLSDKSHFVQPSSPRFNGYPEPVSVHPESMSFGRARGFVHTRATPSATSCSQNSELLQSISPNSVFLGSETAISAISSDVLDGNFSDLAAATYSSRSNFSHLQNYFENPVDRFKPDRNEPHSVITEKYCRHADRFSSSSGVTSYDENVAYSQCLPCNKTKVQVKNCQVNSEGSETVHTNDLDRTKHSTDDVQKTTEPMKGSKRTAVSGYPREQNTDRFLFDCSLSSCLSRLQYSTETSSNISDLVAALGSPPVSSASERLEDVSRSTTDDIRLMESLSCTPPLQGNGRLSQQLDSTFEKSFFSDSNSELAFSDSLALELNAARSTYKKEDLPSSRKSKSYKKNDPSQRYCERQSTESANPLCVRKCTFVRNDQDLLSESHTRSKRSTEPSAVYGHIKLKENENRQQSVLSQQLDSTFEKSFFSDSNSELAFSDSLALELNAARSTCKKEDSPSSRKSKSYKKNDPSQRYCERQSAESASPLCVRKCTFVRNDQDLLSESHKRSKRSTEPSAVYGHIKLKENENRQLSRRSETTKKAGDAEFSKERIPVRSVAFAELLRRF